MLRKTVMIDGKEVQFKASAAVPRIYRIKFGRDLFVDLQKIVGDYGIKDRSVKKMTAIILGFKISKAQQLSNWEAEVLSEPQIKYAATDAWVCREMYIRLMQSSPVADGQ